MKLKTFVPAALLLLAGAAGAQNVPAPVVSPTLTAAPLEMKLKLTPGQVRAYRITINQDSAMTLPGAGQGMPVKMDLTTDAKLFVDKANPDGSYAVRFRVGGTKANLSVNGQSMPMPGLPESTQYAGTVQKDGSFKPSADTVKKAGISGMGMDPGQLMSGLFANLMSIPDRPVAVGDTWITTVAMPLDPTGASTISVSNKILGVDTGAGGEQVARIQQDYSGPMALTLTQPAPMTLTGTITGSGVSKVSVASGQTLSSASNIRMVGDIDVGSAAGNGEAMKMKMDSTVVSKIESTLLPSAPAKKPAPKVKPKV